MLGSDDRRMPTARVALAVLGMAVACACSAVWGATSAAAASAWWQVGAGARPANLWLPKNEVQEFTGSGLLIVGGKAVIVASKATAESAQKSLEGAYGAGNVKVSGGPVGAAPLVVTSIGADAGRYVAPIEGGRAEVVTPGGSGKVILTATNLGETAVSGTKTPVRIADALPSGITPYHIEGLAGIDEVRNGEGPRGPVHCVQPAGPCTFAGTLAPYERIEVSISVSVTANPPQLGAEDGVTATVSGGEGGGTAVQPRSLHEPLTVSATPTPFGVERYEMTPEEAGGAVDMQAGSHPFQLTTLLVLNQTALVGSRDRNAVELPPALPKDLEFKLPPGLVGNATAMPQCSDAEFSTEVGDFQNACPANTAIGVVNLTLVEHEILGLVNKPVPVFNLTPAKGEPARFGFEAYLVPVVLDTSVRTGEGYGVTVSVKDITEAAAFMSSDLTFWGVPGDPRHDEARGWACLEGEASCTPLGEKRPVPFLTLPTSCTGPLQTTVEADSWATPGSFTSPTPYAFPQNEIGQLFGQGGCNHIGFEPSIGVAPDVSDASTPSGLTVHVRVPQEASLNPTGIGEADVRDTTVTLPEGVQLSPSGANNLEACSEQEIGYEGVVEGERRFTPTVGSPFCPDGSKVATVEIKTPLLPNPLTGAVYLAEQEANPFGSLVALYLVAEDPVSGVLVKLPGKVVPNPVTGQLVSTFEDTPQLPFEELILGFFGGERAPLATPAHCGAYTTDAEFVPWSGNGVVDSTSSFQITSGPNGTECPGRSLAFSPSLAAGVSSIQAGGFSPFTMTMSRPDGQQSLQAIQLKMPDGLSGMLSHVKLCGEPRASQGLCGAESEIGETTVSVGLGGDPYTVTGGKVFITGPYDGAPFGLSIVNPAKAGPFDLEKHTACDCLVVRAKIEVDPHTAALTVSSDSSGPYAIPTILDGIPLQIKHVNVTINKPGFMFNPTSCEKMTIGGSLRSAEGATAGLSVPFQVTNCATLAFKPGFTAKTKAKHTRKGGARLQVNVTSKPGQANIAAVHVELPKKLPSRLSTLQKACTEAQFDANPAGCPAESVVGEAVVHTPVLTSVLQGPAYFVSRGAQWPELVIVLQGEGVTVELNGETFISKKGITSTTFKTVPDVPFDTFQLTLPTGSHSALAGNGNLCRKRLVMPVKLTGQNGKVVKHKTRIKVTGCAATRKKGKGAGKHRHHGKHKRAHRPSAS